MKKTTKTLILALLIDALAVFGMQLARWSWTWVFVALYWAILTVKNYVDYINTERKKDAIDDTDDDLHG